MILINQVPLIAWHCSFYLKLGPFFTYHSVSLLIQAHLCFLLCSNFLLSSIFVIITYQGVCFLPPIYQTKPISLHESLLNKWLWVRFYWALGPATKTAVAIAGPTDLIICLLSCYYIVLMSNLYDLVGRNKDYFTFTFTLLF